jgi:hypothetical protein
MSDHLADPDNDAMLAELRAAVSVLDPVPPGAIITARAAIAWREMDAKLAALTADSSLEQHDLALVRSGDMPTLLTFETPALSLEIEIEVAGAGRRLFGQLAPPQPGRVQINHRGGRITLETNDVGRFTADGVWRGPVCLRCQAGGDIGSDDIVTEWFLA